MQKRLILILLLSFSLNSFSQKKFSAEILTGLGFNKDLFIINQEIEAHNIFTTQINASYKFNLYKRIFAETGIGAQWYFTSGNIELSNFKATSLRLNVPFVVGYPISNKISIAGGAIVNNNRDFDDYGYRAKYKFRTSLMIKGYYKLQENLDLLLMFKQNVSNFPDFYLINQPSTDISAGISYKLF